MDFKDVDKAVLEKFLKNIDQASFSNCKIKNLDLTNVSSESLEGLETAKFSGEKMEFENCKFDPFKFKRESFGEKPPDGIHESITTPRALKMPSVGWC